MQKVQPVLWPQLICLWMSVLEEPVTSHFLSLFQAYSNITFYLN